MFYQIFCMFYQIFCMFSQMFGKSYGIFGKTHRIFGMWPRVRVTYEMLSRVVKIQFFSVYGNNISWKEILMYYLIISLYNWVSPIGRACHPVSLWRCPTKQQAWDSRNKDWVLSKLSRGVLLCQDLKYCLTYLVQRVGKHEIFKILWFTWMELTFF